jgi:GTP-binding protein EngB required for normal cell division
MSNAPPPLGSEARSGASPSAGQRRSELERCLHEACKLPGVDAGTVSWLREKLSEEAFNLVVAGQFKRGKSTVVNALLGESLLPAGVVPLTSVVTVIRSGRVPLACVELKSGRTEQIELSALADYVTERGNPANIKSVERVVIDHSSPWLAHGVRLVDTPGIDSVYEHNTDETRKYLPQADAVLFVASVDQPVSRAELEFLAGVRQYAGKIFCLLNKVDYLRPDELAESLAFSTQAIREALGTSIPVFPISARLALEGRESGRTELVERSGFPGFEHALGGFVAREKSNAWLDSIARSLLRVLKQARFRLDLEAKVLSDPLEHIEANLRLFRQEKEKVERARADYQVLLEADAKALLKGEIEPALEEFKRSQQTEIGASIARWFSEVRALPSKKLQRTMEERLISAIRAAYDGWLAREDVRVSRAFQSLCARFWSSMQETVDELMRRSSELFAVEFERVGADARWTTESGFYYQLWYEPTSLRIVSSSLALALPKVLAARLIVKRTTATAVDLLEIHAGRIRHDLEERLKRSVREAQREIVSQIEAAIAGIQQAIESGIATRNRSAELAASRSGELEAARTTIALLEAGLARASSDDKVASAAAR